MLRSKKWLLVTDLEGTMLGDNVALERFNKKLQESSTKFVLVYNSSRPCESVRKVLNIFTHLPAPDYLIGALGTEIEEGQTGELLTGYQNHFQKEWSREEVERVMKRMEFVPHPQEYQSQFKVSYEVPHPVAYTEVLRELDIASIKAKTIFTGQKNLDLIPTSAGKGSALRYLHKQASINAKRVVVAGNSGEDLEMFEAPYKCIVVGNADQELNELEGEHIYHAPSAFADGVLEGLLYWKIL